MTEPETVQTRPVTLKEERPAKREGIAEEMTADSFKTTVVSESTKDHGSRTSSKKPSHDNDDNDDAVKIRDTKDKETYKSHQIEMTGCLQEVNYTNSYFLNSNNRNQEIVKHTAKGKTKYTSRPVNGAHYNSKGLSVPIYGGACLESQHSETKERESRELRNSRAAWATWQEALLHTHTALEKDSVGETTCCSCSRSDFRSQHLGQAIHNCL